MRYPIHGQCRPGATVTVYEEDTLVLATIYTTKVGGAAVAGSVVTADSAGMVVFYLDSGQYPIPSFFDLTISLTGFADITVDSVWNSFYAVATEPAALVAGVVDVCNDALLMIGQAQIVTLNDDNARAKTCKKLWAGVRDATLRAYAWNCAMAYDTLTVDPTAPDWGYSYRFPLPADCIRALSLDDSSYKFKVVGRYLHTDAVSDDAKLRYTQRIEDPTYWDTLLRDAVATRLSAALAYPFTAKLDLGKIQLGLYAAKIREARTADGQEGSIDPYEADDLTTVR